MATAEEGLFTQVLCVLLQEPDLYTVDVFKNTTASCRHICHEEAHWETRERLLALSEWTADELEHLHQVKDAIAKAVDMTGYEELALMQEIWPRVLDHIKRARREKECSGTAANNPATPARAAPQRADTRGQTASQGAGRPANRLGIGNSSS